MNNNKTIEEIYMEYEFRPLKKGERVCVFYTVSSKYIKYYGEGIYLGKIISTLEPNLSQPQFFYKKYNLNLSKEGCVNLDNNAGLVWERDGIFIPKDYGYKILNKCVNIPIKIMKSKENYLSEI